MVILRTEELTRKFGGVTAVDNVSLEIEEGAVTSIIGPNGAGKTTLFNLLTGLYKPSSGSVFFLDTDITPLPVSGIVKMGLTRTFQILNIFNDLTLHENIRVAVQCSMGHGWELLSSVESLKGVDDRVSEIIDEIGLNGKEHHLAGTLSYGDRRILEIGISLASKPRVLLLDEPTSGVGLQESVKVAEFIEKLAKKLTIVLVEHDMNVVLNLSDHIFVLQQGRIIASGKPSEIQENEEVQEAYLGGADHALEG